MEFLLKKRPNNLLSSFYTDDEYDENKRKIKAAIRELKEKLKDYDGVIVPKHGLGTGLAQLDKRAPKTYK